MCCATGKSTWANRHLIIFSVLLALFLTEYFSNLHEKNQTKELLNNIKEELVKNNRKAEQEQYTYEKQVLEKYRFSFKLIRNFPAERSYLK